MSDNNSKDKKSDTTSRLEHKKLKKNDDERAESSSDAIARAAAASLRTTKPKGIQDSSIGKHRTPPHVRDSDFYKQYMKDKYPHGDDDNSMDGRDPRRKWFPSSKAAQAHQSYLTHKDMLIKVYPHSYESKKFTRTTLAENNLKNLEENFLPFIKGMKYPSVPDFRYGSQNDRIRWESHNRFKYNVHDSADSLNDFGAAQYAKKLIPYKKPTTSTKSDLVPDTTSIESSKTTRARKDPEANSDTDSSLTSNTTIGRYLNNQLSKEPDDIKKQKNRRRYERIKKGEDLIKNPDEFSENSVLDYNKFIKVPPEKDKTKYPKMMLMKKENPWLFQVYDALYDKKKEYDGHLELGVPADKEKFMKFHDHLKKQGLLPESLAKKFDADFTKSMSKLNMSEKSSDKGKTSEKDDSTWYKSIHTKDFSNSAERESLKIPKDHLSEMYSLEDKLWEADQALENKRISQNEYDLIKQEYDREMDFLENNTRSKGQANLKRLQQKVHLKGLPLARRRDLDPNDKFKPQSIKPFDHVEYPELEKKYGNGQLDSNVYGYLKPSRVKNILNFGKSVDDVNAKKIRNNLMKAEDRDLYNNLKPYIEHSLERDDLKESVASMRMDNSNWDGRVTKSASKSKSTEKSSSTGTKTMKSFNPDWNKHKNFSEVTRYSQVPSITSSKVSSVSTGTSQERRKIDKVLQANGKLRTKQFMNMYTDAIIKQPPTRSELSELKQDNLLQNFEKKQPTQKQRANWLKSDYVKWRYGNRPDPRLPGEVTYSSPASSMTTYNSHRSFSDKRSTKSAESSATGKSTSRSNESAMSSAKSKSTSSNYSSMSTSSKSDTNSKKRTLSLDSDESTKTVKAKKKLKK